RLLATGGIDTSVRVWEVASGLESRRFTGHGQMIHAVAFSPDCRYLASASGDAPVFVWDVYGAAAPLDPNKLWDDLASDAEHGRAIRALLASPDKAISLLRDQLKPAAAPDATQVQQLLADLDSPRFTQREKALKELE